MDWRNHAVRIGASLAKISCDVGGGLGVRLRAIGSADEGRSARVTMGHVEAIGLEQLADSDRRLLEWFVGQKVLDASADLSEKAARS